MKTVTGQDPTLNIICGGFALRNIFSSHEVERAFIRWRSSKDHPRVRIAMPWALVSSIGAAKEGEAGDVIRPKDATVSIMEGASSRNISIFTNSSKKAVITS